MSQKCQKFLPLRRPFEWDTEDVVKSVEGVCRDGKVELVEPLAESEGSRVIVTRVYPSAGTNLPAGTNLRERGIGESRAEALRRRLDTFT